jgi:hypothetical protein
MSILRINPSSMLIPFQTQRALRAQRFFFVLSDVLRGELMFYSGDNITGKEKKRQVRESLGWSCRCEWRGTRHEAISR